MEIAEKNGVQTIVACAREHTAVPTVMSNCLHALAVLAAEGTLFSYTLLLLLFVLLLVNTVDLIYQPPALLIQQTHRRKDACAHYADARRGFVAKSRGRPRHIE